MLSTHDKVIIPCIFAEKVGSLLSHEDIINASVILINEGQFFEDIYETVLTLVEQMHKKVFVCGLDGDFKRCKFGNLLDLIPYCDNIVKLHSNCANCNIDAIFSHRITREKNQVVIGSDNYMPLCRQCYYNENKNA
jgi:thymidine kinase